MKKLLALAIFATACQVSAQVELENHPYGSGTPGFKGVTKAYLVDKDNDYYHVPQYMPGFPTAATLWPRVITVDCTSAEHCEGYEYSPKFGRAEYLFFKMNIKTIASVNIPSPMEKKPETIIIYKEVPQKRIGE